ncbi:unnamed protein product [Amoebophrya sp. A25]|nr:unnamed protein product [Amoebophrya sp. A25]|eukprot:GSA25T00014312001.1
MRSEMAAVEHTHPFVPLLQRWCNLKDLAFDYVLTLSRPEGAQLDKMKLADRLGGMVRMQKYFGQDKAGGKEFGDINNHHLGTYDTENIAALLRHLLATKPDLVFRPAVVCDAMQPSGNTFLLMNRIINLRSREIENK